MNREIKFRAWDRWNKRFTKPEHLSDSEHLSVENTYCGFRFLNNTESGFDYIQYTGLKDKNGKEIYEGDIVKHNNNKSYDVKFGFFNESVNFDEYSNECYGYYIGGEDEFEDFEQIYNSHKVEIIGNIYENPELLK